MNRYWMLPILMLSLLAFGLAAGQVIDDLVDDAAVDRRVLVLDVQGPIGPATRDFVIRGLETAAERGASLLVIRLDTPGGLDASTRDMIKEILNSPVPVATFVTPEGARAASAGTYILYASHVAAMSPATNVGAATPVAIGGAPTPPRPGPKSPADDEAPTEEGGEPAEGSTAPLGGDAMTRKAVNDSVAYLRGLAELRGRNADWAEKAVRDADSITAETALELGVIDLIAENLAELLPAVDGMEVLIQGRAAQIETQGAIIEQLEPDWRNELLAAITSPTIAYILLLMGIYGLILEGYNPGAILPGVVGAICLLLALYALQMLPVNYVGLGLIVLGVILMIAEAIAPSFGVLGFGGIIALVIGSIILVDTDVPGMGVSMPLIGSIAAVGGVGLMAIIGFAVKARQRPVVAGREELIGAEGRALESFERDGEVWVHSENWRAVSKRPVAEGQPVRVTGLDGLVLEVEPLSAASDMNEPAGEPIT